MKKVFKLFSIIAFVAIIGFSMAACFIDDNDDGTGGDGLTAPTGFTATPYSSSSIILTWNAVPGATGYNVYDGTSPTNLNGPGTVSSNYANNYNLPANTTVYYQIAAYNANGEGPRSNVVSATTLSANNYSLNGVWEITDGTQITISGSTGVFKVFGGDFVSLPLFADAKNKGYIKLGDQFWRNLTSTGNLTWSGQEMVVQNYTSTPNVAIGISYENCTFTMSADGRALTRTSGSNNIVATRKQ